MFSNIWKHPKTSAAGVLTSAMVVTGVLSQQGITLGHAGTGTVVALIGGIAAAFLGLLSRDPKESDASTVVKTGGTAAVIAALCGLLVFAPVMGCTQQQKLNVAQEIVNLTPVLQSAIATAGGIVDVLDPVAAPIVNTVVTDANLLAPQFTAAAQAYLANPTQTTLQTLQALIVQIQNAVNAQLLAAAKIVNPQSQQKATVAINGIGTIANSLLALIQSISTKTQVAAMSRNVTVHLAAVESLLDRNAINAQSAQVARQMNMPVSVSADRYLAYEAQAGF